MSSSLNALVRALHDQLPDELGESGEDVEDQASARGGRVEGLVQALKADLSFRSDEHADGGCSAGADPARVIVDFIAYEAELGEVTRSLFTRWRRPGLAPRGPRRGESPLPVSADITSAQ